MRAYIELDPNMPVEDVSDEPKLIRLTPNMTTITIEDAESGEILSSLDLHRRLPAMGINIVDGQLMSMATTMFDLEAKRSILNPMALELAGVVTNKEWMHNE